jgi:hypothetical protein
MSVCVNGNCCGGSCINADEVCCGDATCPVGYTCCGDVCCNPWSVCNGDTCEVANCAAVREQPTIDRPCCPGLVANLSGCDSGCCFCLYPVGAPQPGTGQCGNGCDCSGGAFATTCCENGICSTRPHGVGC